MQPIQPRSVNSFSSSQIDMRTKPPAVIVGMESNGLGVARSLSPRKMPLIALATPRWNPACKTNTCEVVYSSAWSCHQ